MGHTVKATHEHAKSVLLRVLSESEREQITGEIALKLIFNNGGLRRIHIVKETTEQLPASA